MLATVIQLGIPTGHTSRQHAQCLYDYGSESLIPLTQHRLEKWGSTELTKQLVEAAFVAE